MLCFCFFLCYDDDMLHVLASIIPLGIGSILASPIIFVVAIVLLSQTYYPKIKWAAFFLPALIVSVLATYAGYVLGHTITQNSNAIVIKSSTDILIACIFFFLAFFSWFVKEKKFAVNKDAKGMKILKWFIIGSIMNGTNFNALVLVMAAGKEVGSSGLPQLVQWLLLLLNIFFYTLTVSFPFFLILLFPKHSSAMLKSISLFLKRYSKLIVAVLFFVFGVIFLNRAFPFV